MGNSGAVVGDGVGVELDLLGVGLGEVVVLLGCVSVGLGEVVVGVGVLGSAGLVLLAMTHQAPRPKAITRMPMITMSRMRFVPPRPPPGGCGGCP